MTKIEVAYRLVKIAGKAVSVGCFALVSAGAGIVMAAPGDYFSSGESATRSESRSVNDSGYSGYDDVRFAPVWTTTTTDLFPDTTEGDFTLTFNAGADAGSVGMSVGTRTQNYDCSDGCSVSTDTDADYTANLVFKGGNTVYGETDIQDGRIDIDGNNVVLSDQVTADDIHLNGAYTLTLGAGLYGLDGDEGNVHFNGHQGTVRVDSGDISGNVTTSIRDSGTLVFGGGVHTQLVGGSIGGGSTPLAQIELGGAAGVTVEGDTHALKIDYKTGTTLTLEGDLNSSDNPGVVNFGNYDATLRFNDSENKQAHADVVSNNQRGVVHFDDVDNLSFTGNLGTVDQSIGNVLIERSDVSVTGDINAKTLTVGKGRSTLSLNGTEDKAAQVNARLVDSSDAKRLTLANSHADIRKEVDLTTADLRIRDGSGTASNITFHDTVSLGEGDLEIDGKWDWDAEDGPQTQVSFLDSVDVGDDLKVDDARVSFGSRSDAEDEDDVTIEHLQVAGDVKINESVVHIYADEVSVGDDLQVRGAILKVEADDLRVEEDLVIDRSAVDIHVDTLTVDNDVRIRRSTDVLLQAETLTVGDDLEISRSDVEIQADALNVSDDVTIDRSKVVIQGVAEADESDEPVDGLDSEEAEIPGTVLTIAKGDLNVDRSDLTVHGDVILQHRRAELDISRSTAVFNGDVTLQGSRVGVDISGSAVTFNGDVALEGNRADLNIRDRRSSSSVSFDGSVSVGDDLAISGRRHLNEDDAPTTVAFNDSVNVGSDLSIEYARVAFGSAETAIDDLAVGQDLGFRNSEALVHAHQIDVQDDLSIHNSLVHIIAGGEAAESEVTTLDLDERAALNIGDDFSVRKAIVELQADSVAIGGDLDVTRSSSVLVRGIQEIDPEEETAIEDLLGTTLDVAGNIDVDRSQLTVIGDASLTGSKSQLNVNRGTAILWGDVTLEGAKASVNVSGGQLHVEGDLSVTGELGRIEIKDRRQASEVVFGGDVTTGDDIRIQGKSVRRGQEPQTTVMFLGDVRSGDDIDIERAAVQFGSEEQAIDILRAEDSLSLKQALVNVQADKIEIGNDLAVSRKSTLGVVTDQLQVADDVEVTGRSVVSVIANGSEFAEGAPSSAIHIGEDLEIEDRSQVLFQADSIHIGDDLDVRGRSLLILSGVQDPAAGDDDPLAAATVHIGGDVAISGGSSLGIIGDTTVSGKVDVRRGSEADFLGTLTLGAEGDAGRLSVSRSEVYLGGGLVGDLRYEDSRGNGSEVVVAHDKAIDGSITTRRDGRGTLAFEGATTLAGDIGTLDKRLKAVHFNTGQVTVSQNIGHDVHAKSTVFGEGSEAEDNLLGLKDVTAQYDFGGTGRILAFTGGTSVNITDDVHFGGDLLLHNHNTALNVGNHKVSVADALHTGNGALSFIVNTLDITGVDQAASTSEGSGQIRATELVMGGEERVHINYLGSLANQGTYTLVALEPMLAMAPLAIGPVYAGSESSGLVSDNSYVIDTVVRQATFEDVEAGRAENTGDLFLLADRSSGGSADASQLYVNKSNTQGHHSNNASRVLAGIAASGLQSGDMIEVIQKLEIDDYGYGNTAANLAREVKRLTPVANNALSMSALRAQSAPNQVISQRLNSGRSGLSSGDGVLRNGAWIQAFGNTGKQSSSGGYEGFETDAYGLVIGAERRLDSGTTLGVAFSYTETDVEQRGLNAGDKGEIKAYQLHGYLSTDLSERVFLDGSLSYAQLDYSMRRTTALDRVAEADYDGAMAAAGVTLGYRLYTGESATFSPLFKVEHTYVDNDGYTETGADALNLRVSGESFNQTRAGVGFLFDGNLSLGAVQLKPELSVLYTRDFDDLSSNLQASFVGDVSGTRFSTPQSGIERNALNVGAGVSFAVTESSSLELRYDLEKRSGYTGHGGVVKFSWDF